MLPIIFFHTGSQLYLKYAIETANKFNENVFLIGDESNRNFCENWCSINSLKSEKFEKFKKVYHHMSTNDFKFELECFKRYFLLRELMIKKGINRCILLDSDVLNFINYSDINQLNDYQVGFSVPNNQSEYDWVASPHIFYCTYEMLDSFIDFVLDTYINNINKLEEKYKYHIDNKLKGGVCDMTLLFLWSKKVKYYNFYNAIDIIFDHAVQERNGYKYDKILLMKKVVIENNKVFFIKNNSKEKVPVAMIHFQGSAKSIMGDYFYDRNIIVKIYHRYFDILGRLIKKLKKRITV